MRLDRERLDKCSDILSKEQFIYVGHMSKRTATYLLDSKLVPAIYNGKKSKCYFIKKKDIIEFFNDFAIMPEKYLAPPKWYSEKKKIKTKSYRLRLNPEKINIEKLEYYYRQKLDSIFEDDVLKVQDVSIFTGYKPSTVRGWINADKMEVLILPGKRYYIPKELLIEWLLSDTYNKIERKSGKHLKALWGCCN